MSDSQFARVRRLQPRLYVPEVERSDSQSARA